MEVTGFLELKFSLGENLKEPQSETLGAPIHILSIKFCELRENRKKH